MRDFEVTSDDQSAIGADAAAFEIIVVVRPGMFTTFQDVGRPGHARFGVSPSGAMDRSAHLCAAALVGNDPAAAALELTGPGAEFRFLRACRFALVGADLDARLGDLPLALPFVGDAAADARLTFGTRKHGARCMFAVAGGFATKRPFGSAAVDVTGGVGPYAEPGGTTRPLPAGIRLRAVDALQAAGRVPVDASVRSSQQAAWREFRPELATTSTQPTILRFIPEEEGGVALPTARAFAAHTWRLSSRSNRAGFRFDGEPLMVAADPERLSEPTAPGAIQLPPDGLPILLMADRNTTGGYPRLGHLASCDRDKAAQLWPGDAVCFEPITAADAQSALRTAHRQLEKLLSALRP